MPEKLQGDYLFDTIISVIPEDVVPDDVLDDEVLDMADMYSFVLACVNSQIARLGHIPADGDEARVKNALELERVRLRSRLDNLRPRVEAIHRRRGDCIARARPLPEEGSGQPPE